MPPFEAVLTDAEKEAVITFLTNPQILGLMNP